MAISEDLGYRPPPADGPRARRPKSALPRAEAPAAPSAEDAARGPARRRARARARRRGRDAGPRRRPAGRGGGAGRGLASRTRRGRCRRSTRWRRARRPLSMRGLHVTMALASIPGKLDEYLKVPGLNTVQLDVKDENGDVGFVPSAVPFARAIGAAKPYYKPRQAALLARKRGVYLIGRIVCFEDPVLSAARPAMAVQRTDGSRWVNHAGLGWADPYNRDVWRYIGDLAVATARLGFDEIQLDYVRFPTDGDVEAIRYPVADGDADGLGDPGVRPVRRQAPEADGRAPVGRRLRPVGDARPRDRPDPAADLALPRRDLPDGLPVALRPRRARARRPQRVARPDRRRLALRLQPRARGPEDDRSSRGCRTSRTAARTPPRR